MRATTAAGGSGGWSALREARANTDETRETAWKKALDEANAAPEKRDGPRPPPAPDRETRSATRAGETSRDAAPKASGGPRLARADARPARAAALMSATAANDPARNVGDADPAVPGPVDATGPTGASRDLQHDGATLRLEFSLDSLLSGLGGRFDENGGLVAFLRQHGFVAGEEKPEAKPWEAIPVPPGEFRPADVHESHPEESGESSPAAAPPDPDEAAASGDAPEIPDAAPDPVVQVEAQVEPGAAPASAQADEAIRLLRERMRELLAQINRRIDEGRLSFVGADGRSTPATNAPEATAQDANASNAANAFQAVNAAAPTATGGASPVLSGAVSPQTLLRQMVADVITRLFSPAKTANLTLDMVGGNAAPGASGVAWNNFSAMFSSQTRTVTQAAQAAQNSARAQAQTQAGSRGGASALSSLSVTTTSLRLDVSLTSALSSLPPSTRVAVEEALGISFEGVFCDPIVLDLGGDGFDLRSAEEGVDFDLAGTGTARRTGFVRGDDALLFMDLDGDGVATHGKELFGDQHGDAHGFAMLARFDDNADGAIDADDEIYDRLRVWQDWNGDGVCDKDEVMTLREAGVAALQLAYKDTMEMDRSGNLIAQTGSFTRADGRSGAMIDALLRQG